MGKRGEGDGQKDSQCTPRKSRRDNYCSESLLGTSKIIIIKVKNLAILIEKIK